MTSIASFVLFVVLAILPTDWPVILYHLEPDILCLRSETSQTRMNCTSWDTEGLKSTEDNLTTKQVVAKWGLK